MTTTPKPKWARAGYVAEYCAICHDIRAHVLLRPVGGVPGTPTLVECGTCGQRYAAEMDVFASILPEPLADVAVLMHRTNPLLPARIEERFVLDCAALDGTLPRPERLRAIREPLILTRNALPKRQSLGALIVGALVLAFAPWMAAVIFFETRKFNPLGSSIAMALTLMVLIAVFACLLGLITGWNERRKFRKHVLPRIARAMRPLNPSPSELGITMDWLSVACPRMRRLLRRCSITEKIPGQPDTAMLVMGGLDILAMAAELRAGTPGPTE